MGDSNGLIIAALIAAGIGGPVAVFALLARISAARWVLGVMLFISSLAVALDWFDRPQKLWIYPLQVYRSEIFLVLGMLLFVAILGHMGRISFRRISMLAMMLMTVALYASLLRIAHEGPVQGITATAFVFATIAPLMLVIPALISSWDDFYPLLRMVMWVSMAWIFCVAVQFVVNRNNLTLGRGLRFTGLTANPQHAAVFLGVVITICLWLLLNDPKRVYQPLWIALLGANLVLIGWTGSRTGIGMVVIGATFVLYSRAGRAILFLPVAALFAFVTFKIFLASSVDLGLERLISTQNTRGDAWATMIRSGMSSPIFGVGIGEAGDTENSLLLAFAAYGVGMVALVLLLMVTGGIIVLQVFKNRSAIPREHRTLADLVIAYIVMYFAAAMLEGFIMSRVSHSIVFLIMFGSMAVAIRRLGHQETAQLTWSDESPWPDYDEDDGYGSMPESSLAG